MSANSQGWFQTGFACVRVRVRARTPVRVHQLSAPVEGVTQIHVIPHSLGKDV